MLYALFGVPLMLICLSSLGGFLAETLQCAYLRLCRRRKKRGVVYDDIDTDEYGDELQNRHDRTENDQVNTEYLFIHTLFYFESHS